MKEESLEIKFIKAKKKFKIGMLVYKNYGNGGYVFGTVVDIEKDEVFNDVFLKLCVKKSSFRKHNSNGYYSIIPHYNTFICKSEEDFKLKLFAEMI